MNESTEQCTTINVVTYTAHGNVIIAHLGEVEGCVGWGGGVISLSLTLAPIDRQVFVPWVLNVQTPSPPVPKRAVYGRTWDVDSTGRTYVVTLGDGQWYAARGQQGSVSPGARPGRAPVLREELKAEGRSESWGSAAPTIRRRSLVQLLLDRRRGDGGVNKTQTRVLNALQRQTHHRTQHWIARPSRAYWRATGGRRRSPVLRMSPVHQ